MKPTAYAGVDGAGAVLASHSSSIRILPADGRNLSALLLQVYKGRLKTGEQVAVKVQRPNVVETVSVDLFIIRCVPAHVHNEFYPLSLIHRERKNPMKEPTLCRSMGLALRRFFPITQERVDIVGLLDEWAARFFEELDYVREGNNATRFAEEMRRDLPQASNSAAKLHVDFNCQVSDL